MTMHSNFVRRATVTLAALATLVVALNGTALAGESPYRSIVVFGDSLEDPGNAFVLTGQIATQPFAPIPASAYAVGGHHFSNGRTRGRGGGGERTQMKEKRRYKEKMEEIR